jgi:hypothetical protein
MTKSFVVTVGKRASKPNGHKVRFTLVSGAVESGMGNPVASAGGASASHGESGFWKNRADPNTVRRVALVFPNGTVQGYYKSEQEAEESLAFFKKNSMFGKDCTVVVEGAAVASGGRSYARTYKGKVIGYMPMADLGVSEVSLGEMLPSGLLAPHGNNRFMDLRSGAGQPIMSMAHVGFAGLDYVKFLRDSFLEEFPGLTWELGSPVNVGNGGRVVLRSSLIYQGVSHNVVFDEDVKGTMRVLFDGRFVGERGTWVSFNSRLLARAILGATE